MNKHYPIISKRGALCAGLFLFINLCLLSLFLALFLQGGSRIWLLPLIIFIVFALFGLFILVSVLRAGIDIQNGIVILPDVNGVKGNIPKFSIEDLLDIVLRDCDGKTLDPDSDSLIGARFVFILKEEAEEIYYPVAVTSKQFHATRRGMLSDAEAARRLSH